MSYIPDQARRLHEIMRRVRPFDNVKDKKNCKVICITSGKGGVGKTSFTINFAIALSEMGQKVGILDADFGFSNVDIMLGASSKYNMSHVLSGERRLEEVMEQCFPNVWHISGGAGLSDLIRIDKDKLTKAMEQLEELESRMDYILIDTGAGINDNVLKMIDASDITILIMTSEPTSIIDSYVVIKTAAELENHPKIMSIINRADSEKTAQDTYNNFSKVVEKHLSQNINMMGYLPLDNKMSGSISSLTPYIMKYPKSVFSQRIREMAAKLAGQPVSQKSGGVVGFFGRFFGKEAIQP